MLEIVLTSIISIVVAVVVSRYFSSRISLSWAYNRRKVLDPVGASYPEGIDIYLDGEKIDNLVEWKIGIWNSGNRPIRSGDFIDKSEITIEFPYADVLRHSLRAVRET